MYLYTLECKWKLGIQWAANYIIKLVRVVCWGSADGWFKPACANDWVCVCVCGCVRICVYIEERVLYILFMFRLYGRRWFYGFEVSDRINTIPVIWLYSPPNCSVLVYTTHLFDRIFIAHKQAHTIMQKFSIKSWRIYSAMLKCFFLNSNKNTNVELFFAKFVNTNKMVMLRVASVKCLYIYNIYIFILRRPPFSVEQRILMQKLWAFAKKSRSAFHTIKISCAQCNIYATHMSARFQYLWLPDWGYTRKECVYTLHSH